MLVNSVSSNITMKKNISSQQIVENAKLQNEADKATISSPDMYDGISISPYPYLAGDDQQIDKCLGPVYGNSQRTRCIFYLIPILFRTLIGGEIKASSKLSDQTQQAALRKMIANAKELGADAVIGFNTTERGNNLYNFFCAQGIAVKTKKGSNKVDIENMKKYGTAIPTTPTQTYPVYDDKKIINNNISIEHL